jgi:peptidoglycan/xylan/chitin deacetylase (PgdA/CDA1 family)
LSFVLTYHDVVPIDRREDVGFAGRTAARYKLTPESFAEHLSAISTTHAAVGVIDEAKPLPDVALTFDDGGASAEEIARSLEGFGWRGHFFVATGKIGAPGFVPATTLVELAARGHVIGSHSHTHPFNMGKLDPKIIDREWQESHARLGGILGAPPTMASVPGGLLTRPLIESAARAGYRFLLTSEPRATVRQVGPISVIGRFSVWSTTPAATAAKYARGGALAGWRLLVEWKAKGAAKRVSPTVYERARSIRARL